MARETRIGPVRIALRTLAPDTIRRLSAERRAGEDPWEEDVEELVGRIQAIRWNEIVDSQVLRRWATHPDERVPIAVLRSSLMWGGATARQGHDREIVGLIMASDRDSRTEGEAWNPTLDALARAVPNLWCLDDELNEPEVAGADDRSDESGPTVWIREKIAPEFRKHGLSTEQAKHLLEFTESKDLTATVLTSVTPDVGFVRWLSEHRLEDLATLAAREGLDAEVEAAIWHSVTKGLANTETAQYAAVVFERLRKRGALPSDAFAQLLAIAEAKASSRSWILAGLLQKLLAARQFGPEDPTDFLYRFYQIVRYDQSRVRSLVLHSRASEELCARIAADTSFGAIRQEIANRFGDSAVVRNSLKKITARGVLERIARHAAGEELLDILDRLARRHPVTAIALLNQRAYETAMDAETCKAPLIRYFERLIVLDPEAALNRIDMVSRQLGENRVRPEWIRKIARGLVKRDPVLLRDLHQDYLKVLEPNDWLAALQSTENRAALTAVLVRIPSAVTHPLARKLIFEHGGRDEVLGFLEKEPVRPEEARTAARAILRAAIFDFDRELENRPELMSALEPADLTPLLESSNSAIRQRAILLLGKIRCSADEPVSGQKQQGYSPQSQGLIH